MAATDDLAMRDGLRVLHPAAAVIRVSEPFFQDYPIETQVVLGLIPDASDVLRRLADGGHSVVAGWAGWQGTFRRIGRAWRLVDEIVATMRAADYVVRETDPFGKRASRCSGCGVTVSAWSHARDVAGNAGESASRTSAAARAATKEDCISPPRGRYLSCGRLSFALD